MAGTETVREKSFKTGGFQKKIEQTHFLSVGRARTHGRLWGVAG
jgi:hypothetical protein